MYDIIIIGSGPAGLTAALYALRADKRVLVLEKENFGGQITFSPKVENYPAFMQISGNELAQKLMDQVMEHGADIELGEVTGIVCEPDRKKVLCTDEVYEARAVIIATGSRHRQLGLEGENELIGAGISYCAVCDGAFYKGKTVAVIGGGDTALGEALYLSDIAQKVYLIHRRDEFRGNRSLCSRVAAKENIETVMSAVPEEITGESRVDGIVVSIDGNAKKLDTDGVFVAVGTAPASSPLDGVVKMNDGYIVAGEDCITSDNGIFAAGDVREKPLRQVITAAADGANSVYSAEKYLREIGRAEQ